MTIPDNSHPDTDIPGGVYLCQVNDKVSCGACCGLYNVPVLTRKHLTTMLARRTARFQKTHRSLDGILAFKQVMETIEDQRRPFPEFHHCPYIGLIGANRSRVGCLLHPLARGNHGIDYRGLSYYGGMACRIYFCPTYGQVPEVYKKIIVSSFGDWYAYGLAVTEWRLLNAFFLQLENRMGHPFSQVNLSENEGCSHAARELLTLKMDWPFRSLAGKGPAHYFFKDRRYARPPIDYERLGTAPSNYDSILVELESAFTARDDLLRAEALLESVFNRAADTIRRTQNPDPRTPNPEPRTLNPEP